MAQATAATATISRRNMLAGAFGAAATATALSTIATPAKAATTANPSNEGARTMGSKIITRDGVEIYYKDWGKGQTVILSHGWPLSADSWEAQAFHLANNGFRVITHDRRGHGRSSQPWDGNDMDHYADDLSDLIEQLDLKEIILIGFSTGGGEISRYIGRHGTGRVAKAGLRRAAADGQDRQEPGRPAEGGLRRHPGGEPEGSLAAL